MKEDIKRGHNINTKKYWQEMWVKRGRKGWVKNKLRYKVLSCLFPRYTLTTKPKRKYYLAVAKLVEGKFCDLGCGIGITCGIYAALTGNISFGMDYSLEGTAVGCKEAKRFKVPWFFFVSDILNIGVKTGYFDTVYLGQVMEHLDNDSAALSEALRILKPGGKLIISVPTEYMPDIYEHVNTYTSEKLKEMLLDVGIVDVSFYDIDKTRYIVSGRKTLL